MNATSHIAAPKEHPLGDLVVDYRNDGTLKIEFFTMTAAVMNLCDLDPTVSIILEPKR